MKIKTEIEGEIHVEGRGRSTKQRAGWREGTTTTTKKNPTKMTPTKPYFSDSERIIAG